MEELIVCAAIKVEGVGNKWDDLYLGLRHSDCFASMKKRRDLLTKDDRVRVRMLQNSEQGFLTSKNRFVSRENAFYIAKNSGQILTKHGDKTFLYSEDIY